MFFFSKYFFFLGLMDTAEADTTHTYSHRINLYSHQGYNEERERKRKKKHDAKEIK